MGRGRGQKSCRGVAGDEAEVEAEKVEASRTHSRIRQAGEKGER